MLTRTLSAPASVETATEQLEDWYSLLQADFDGVITPKEDLSYLVDSQRNLTEPIHRWYTLKEGFSHEMPPWLCKWMEDRYGHSPQKVLDPFIGGGTTGVSLGLRGLSVTGIEYNPFIAVTARAKSAVGQVSLTDLRRAIVDLKAISPRQKVMDIPPLTTLQNQAYVNPSNLQLLLTAHDRIDHMRTQQPVRDLLSIGVAGCVERAFNLRKDGRALRYVPKLACADLSSELGRRWDEISIDVEQHQAEDRRKGCPLFQVHQGSATVLSSARGVKEGDGVLSERAFDTIMYSPPYLNNFDYSEVYKLELWLLGHLATYQDWRELRLGTIRSHHSLAFPETTYLASAARTKEIAYWITFMENSPCIPDSARLRVGRVLRGYFDDMYLALREQWRVLKPGGIMAYVVANSRHYFLPVATDLILSAIAHAVGFQPLDLVVIRRRNGRTRQKHYLRESVAFFRKASVG